MSDYVLFGHRESGHSYKVALALTLAGIPFEFRAVELEKPRGQRRSDWREVSPFGEVPVLVADGRPIFQSDAILLHLARERNALTGGADLDALAGWLFWEANRIGISLPNLRHYTYLAKETDLGGGEAAPGVLDWLRGRLDADLTRLDEELAYKPFLCGQMVSVADTACAGYIFFAEQAGVDLGRWPQVDAWRRRIAGLPGWAHPYELMVEA